MVSLVDTYLASFLAGYIILFFNVMIFQVRRTPRTGPPRLSAAWAPTTPARQPLPLHFLMLTKLPMSPMRPPTLQLPLGSLKPLISNTENTLMMAAMALYRTAFFPDSTSLPMTTLALLRATRSSRRSVLNSRLPLTGVRRSPSLMNCPT